MPELVNPLAAFREGYGTLESMAQDRASRQAGNALAQGDYQGAQGALYGRGMLTEGMGVQRQQMAVQDRQAGQQEAEQKARAAAAAQSLEVLGNVTLAALQVPPEQRAEWFRTQAVPQLQGLPGVTPEAMQELLDPSHDWSDQALNAYRALIGQEAEKLQYFNTRDGVVGVQGGRASMVYEAQPQEADAPNGFRWNADRTALEFIPGGPADPKYAGTFAGVKRAPVRPRSGGGGSAPKLPTGFILDGQ